MKKIAVMTALSLFILGQVDTPGQSPGTNNFQALFTTERHKQMFHK
jgi:hypothetical protein